MDNNPLALEVIPRLNIEIQNTPGPGTYDIPDFLVEWQKKTHSFQSSFKNKGRQSPLYFSVNRDGRYLAPGLYNYNDFVTDMLQQKYGPTYGSKSLGRERPKNDAPHRSTTAPTDAARLSPGMYNVEKYLAIGNIPRNAPPMSMFRSQTSRFKPRVYSCTNNPGPGNYSLPPMPVKPPVSSSFSSRTARFPSSANKVPGPGTYDRCANYTPSGNLSKVGKLYGLFFPVDYYP